MVDSLKAQEQPIGGSHRMTTLARAAATLTLVCGLGAIWLGLTLPDANPYSQRNFPCAEDEALLYAPQFGPDRVGCMYVNEFGLAPEIWERVR